MMNTMPSFEAHNFGGHEQPSSSINDCSGIVKGTSTGKETRRYGVEDSGQFLGGINYRFHKNDSTEEGFLLSKYEQQENQQRSYLDDGYLHNLRFDVLSPPLQDFAEELAKLDEIRNEIQDVSESKNEEQYAFSLASLKLLKKYGHGQLYGKRIDDPSSDALCRKAMGPKFSTEEIMRIAGVKFIQSYSQQVDFTSVFNNPFGISLSELSDEDAENVQLVEFLLTSAEKVGCQQFERANRLLNQCDCLSSYTGNPVQRVVHYFSEALREKIDRETGRTASKQLGKGLSLDLDQTTMGLNLTILECHERIPFCQVARFAGIQSIVENVVGAKRIHVIDLQIGNGVQWAILMQALMSRHECPLELLKISAIGTTSKELIEVTGKRLMSSAESMTIPFSFKVVMVSDMLHLHKDLFELADEETVIVYSEYFLRNLILRPNYLDYMMIVFRCIKPSVMVFMEVDANYNAPSFVNRFIEALFYYSSWFDCLDTCMEHNDPNRILFESMYFRQAIKIIVATEGEERNLRSVKIDVWRAFFARFGLLETKLSTSSLCQARLVLENFACGSSCTLDNNGRSLLIGWKGTPILSLSCWKFTC